MDGFEEVKEFIRALPSRESDFGPSEKQQPLRATDQSSRSPIGKLELIRKSDRPWPKGSERRESRNDQGQKHKDFDQKDYRRRILRYRAAGKLNVEDQVQDTSRDRLNQTQHPKNSDLSLVASRKNLSPSRRQGHKVLKQDQEKRSTLKIME